mgnify:CR=1 FL=1
MSEIGFPTGMTCMFRAKACELALWHEQDVCRDQCHCQYPGNDHTYTHKDSQNLHWGQRDQGKGSEADSCRHGCKEHGFG